MTLDDDGGDIQEAVMEAELETDVPSSEAPGHSDSNTEEEEYTSGFGQLFDRLTFGPLPGKVTFSVLIALFVVLILVASIVSPSIGFFKGVGKVTVVVEHTDYSTIDNDDMSFDVFLSPPKYGILDLSDGEYKLIYDSEVIKSGKISFNSNRKGTITLTSIDYYVDNGEYEIKVKTSGTSGSGFFTAIRTIKSVRPDLKIVYDQKEKKEDEDRDKDYMVIDPGLYATDDPTDKKPVWTKGSGSIEIYFCSSSPKCGNPKLRETITFSINLAAMSWTTESDDDTNDQGPISLFREYWDDDSNDDGYYQIKVTFTNEFSQSDSADTETKAGQSGWAQDDRDQAG